MDSTEKPRSKTRQQSTKSRYGYSYRAAESELDIERGMIRQGGRHWNPNTNHFHGDPLIEHYKRLWLLLWPNQEIDPWAELALKGWLENRILILMGPKNCAKTNSIAKLCLSDWWCFPKDTLWLISSTTLKGAEMRVWGRIKGLYNSAKALWPTLEGRSLESLGCITEQRLEASNTLQNNDLARTLERGIVVVPCKRGGEAVALSSFIGIKAPRLRHGGDEVAVSGDGFLIAYNNFLSEENQFKGIMSGNPTDLLDPLCRASRPVGGWDAFVDTKKTMEWTSSWHNAHVICYDGRDTPNAAFSGITRYKHLITTKDVENLVKTNGEDHPMTYMFAYGKPNRLLASKRVITELLCREHHALDDAIWRGGGRLMVYGLDPAYGGADLCIGMPGEFGLDVDNILILKAYPPEIVPIRVSVARNAEDQIADWIQVRLEQLNIPATSCFYGAFGRGTLGMAFARVFGRECPIAVDEGGTPTRRPVRDDLFVMDKDGGKRLMRCDEYYRKKISELWFTCRLAIESNQIRELPTTTMDQGCMRCWSMTADNKVEVETKEVLKKRMQGESPNEFDCFTFVVEGARQKGFRVARLGADIEDMQPEPEWKKQLRERSDTFWKSKDLNYAA